MTVNFEFLGPEPIENVITCMHFMVDTVVFFGYSEMINLHKVPTTAFLKEKCKVKEVIFHNLSRYDLSSILKEMREEISRFKAPDKIYFDITGGESLLLVAFGMLSREFNTPIHQYDILKDRLIEFDETKDNCMSKNVPVQEVKMDIKSHLKLKGAAINNNFNDHTSIPVDPENMNDIDNIWDIANRNWIYWNMLSILFRENLKPDQNLYVHKSIQYINEAIRRHHWSGWNFQTFTDYLTSFSKAGLISDPDISIRHCSFRFKDETLKNCLWKAGNILEIHTYQVEKNNSDDCMTGVHIDWDGVIHPSQGEDVLNEVDVISMKENIPSFISCKTGKMNGNTILHALYELDTVTRRFGGKYAKKILITAESISDNYQSRADEMNIEIRQLNR